MRRMKGFIKTFIFMLIVFSILSTGCSSDKTGDGSVEVAKDYYVLLVMNQNGEVVSDANVSIDGNSYTTASDGTVKFERPEKSVVSLVITCMDYYDYTNEAYQILSDSSDVVTIMSKTLASHRLESAVYHNTDALADVGVELLSEHKKLNMSTPDLDFNITAKVLGDSEKVSKYELHQMVDGKDSVIATSQTGTFENLKVKDFKVGTNVFITVYDEQNHQTSTAINLEIGADPNYTEFTEISLGEEVTFKVADDIPIFGGTDFNLDFPIIPLDVVFSEDKVHVGFNVDEDTFDDEEAREDYKELLSEIIRTKNTLKDGKSLIKKLKERQKNKGIMRLSGFDAGVDVCVGGYVEAGFDSYGQISTGEGSLCVTVTGEAEFGWQVIVWVIPVTIDIEGEIVADLAGTVSYSFNENKFYGDVAITISPSITAKAGVGFEYLSAGVYGSAGLETQLIIASITEDPGFKYVDFTSSLGIYAKLAFFEPEKDLLTGTFNLWTRGEENTLSSDNYESLDCESYSEILLDGLYDVENYAPIAESDEIQLEVCSMDSYNVIASGINSGSSPVSATNDTTALTVFSAQQQLGESTSTYSKLFYSYYEDGQWLDNGMIDEEVKNQMNPQLYTDGIDYYLMYQEADFDNMLLEDYDNKTIEERRVLMEQAFLSFDLHVKKFDTETKEFVDCGKIETLDVYDYNASMVIVDGVPYVYGVANDAGDFFGTGETTSNNIICAFYKDGVWEYSVVQENLKSVTRLVAGKINDNIACVYSVDGDNNLMTTDDVITYCHDGAVTEIYEGNVTQILNTDLPLTNEISFLIATEEGLFKLNNNMGLDSIFENDGSYLNKYAVSDNAIYDVRKVNTGTEIFALYPLEDGGYSLPVQMTFEDKWQKDISAYSIDGRDVVVALSEVYDEYGIETELVTYDLGEFCNLSVDSVYINYKDIMALDEIPIEMTLKNNGNTKITGADISVTDANGNQLEIANGNYDISLNPGASQTLTVCVKKSENIGYGKWEFEANISNDVVRDVMDVNQDDNVYEFSTGYSDFVVSTSVKDTGTYPFLLLEVENVGNISDSARVVLLDANDTSVELKSYSISSLEAGDTVVYKANLEEEWASENGKISVLVKVVDSGEEMYIHNNYSYEYATINYGTYDIDYELNGGINSSENPDAYTTADSLVFNEPTKEDFKFVGWYTTPSFDSITQVTEITPGTAGNISLYAAWVELGDALNNGGINAEDALLVLKYAARIVPISDLQIFAADVNEDGMVNSQDALLILKYAANMIQSFN